VTTIKKRGRKAAPRKRPRPVAPARPGADYLELAMRAINEGVYDWDIATGATYYSERVTAAVGLSAKELKTAADWHNRIHPEDRPRYDAALVAHFKGKTERFECDVRYRASDGSWRWARQHGIAVRDARGRAVRMVGSTGDISELKRIELALKESENRYVLAMQVATEGIYDWNVETGALVVSDKAREYWGFPSGPLKNTNWTERIHPEDYPAYRQAVIDHFKGRTPLLEHQMRSRDARGEYRWVVDRGIAVRNAEGRAIRLVGAENDITERKQHEDELRRARDEATAALERQQASADVLRSISDSIADTAPVFDKILENCKRLFAGRIIGVNVVREDGMLHIGAYHGAHREQFARIFPLPPTSGAASWLAIMERRVVHYPDAQHGAEVPASTQEGCKAIGIKSVIFAPMLREGRGLGAIFVGRDYLGEFSPKDIELLRTFADQAAIAIENVRLFNETKEALERQTATAEILNVIASSPSDVQPVFDAIAQSAYRLLGGFSSAVARVFDGVLHLVAFSSTSEAGDEALKHAFPTPVSRSKAARTGKPVSISDTETLPDSASTMRELARTRGFRSILIVPMLREGVVTGTISVTRREAGEFSDHQVALLKTFADQAVIAIENVRLFNETKEALERQTATAEILKVIASSPSDVQPVFDAIAHSARRLLGGFSSSVARVDGDLIHLAAVSSGSKSGDEALRRVYPRPLTSESGTQARAILSGKPAAVVDTETAPRLKAEIREMARARGFRSAIGVPMIHNRIAVGAITVTRKDPGSFSDHQIGLLQTFADQAVIAIENVRLFNETKEALEFQKASGEILAAISASIADTRPVFEAIVRTVLRLLGTRFAAVFVLNAGQIEVRAFQGEPGFDKIMEAYPRPLDESVIVGKAMLERKVLQVAPIAGNPAAPPGTVELGRRFGYDAIIAAPMIREGKVIGGIATARGQGAPFDAKQVALLQAFADQAVIAIENARLFNETKEALERQTATSEILKVIASSPSDVKPVFDAILEGATRLCDAHLGVMNLYDGEHFRTVALRGGNAKFRKWVFERGPFKLPQLIHEGRAFQVADLASGEGYRTGSSPNAVGFVDLGRARTIMMVPLLKDRQLLGNLAIYRPKVRPFSQKQIDLVATFADQAVIAIENVRLFNETKESLERQTATAEVLRVISSSPTDTQPVFDAIARSCQRLFSGETVALALVAGGQVVPKAGVDGTGAALDLERLPPWPLDRGSATGASVLDNRAINLADLSMVDEEFPRMKDLALRLGYRSGLWVPLRRESGAIGSISILRRESGAFTDQEVALAQTFADQAVIAIENVRLFNETKEALERQTATAEILKVISSSPTDTQPVFEAIAQSVVRLCDGLYTYLGLFDGKMIDFVAFHNVSPQALAIIKERFPSAPDLRSSTGRAILERTAIHIPDVMADTEYSFKDLARADGYRAILAIPMLREGNPIGTIAVGRRSPFTEDQIELVKTFADQAVIAIENVRLFNETKEALERQRATAEILSVIAGSPTDTKPVFDAIAACGAQLLGAVNAAILLRRESQVEVVGLSESLANNDLPGRVRVLPLDREKNFPSQVILDAKILHIPDWEGSDIPEFERNVAKAYGVKACLQVPLLHKGEGIGAIVVSRVTAGAFPEEDIALLKSFADQAVIAIENVRLFNETKEALERQTATAEILKVIASSPSDVQPVFDAIARSAVRLVGGHSASVTRVSGDHLHLVALTSTDSAADELVRSHYPMPLEGRNPMLEVLRSGRTLLVRDTETDPRFPEEGREVARARGFRTIVFVPMLRDGAGAGVIHLAGVQPNSLTDSHVRMLETFADQAVIAIENVRLFNETKESLERQTATAEILKVISESPTDTKPVFETITQSAARLFAPCNVTITTLKDGLIHWGASAGAGTASHQDVDRVRSVFPIPLDAGRSPSARAIAERRVVEIVDTEAPDAPELAQRSGKAFDFRSGVFIPLIRENQGIGTLVLTRPEPGFRLTEKQLSLVKTFADQAVIAIENVRLFKELQARTDALTKSVGQLTALGEVGRAVSSTLDLDKVLKTIVSRAVQLTGVNGGTIYEFDELRGEFHLRASENMADELVQMYRSMPIRLGEGTVGRAVAARAPMQEEDIQNASYQTRYRELLIRCGYRAVLAVPLLRDEHIVGALTVLRDSPGAFAPEVVELLQTFATQSAMAIQNARLFREIADKGKQLEIASQHKSQFLASMSHELRTPLNAILGFNEMILDQVYGDISEDVKAPLENMQSSGKHLLRLINNVLDLAKIEAGKMDLALSDYLVQDTVASVHATLKPLAAEKGLEFLAKVPSDLPPAYGDGGRIAQCLMNLAGNSIKFTKAGKVEIAVEQKDSLLLYRVADTGIGIPKDKIETLFTEFKQTDATVASEYGGTGLGLSITKKFIEMHGGRIWIESEPGKGSTFLFEVPLRAAQ